MTDLDPVAAMHRANQAFHAQGVRTASLECGVAHFSAEFGAIANQLREFKLPEGWSMAQAYERVESFFASQAHPCRRWAPALEQPAEEMESFLAAKGFAAHQRTVMVLRPWPMLEARDDVRLLPGRAIKPALAELVVNDVERGPEQGRILSAEMLMERLDDPGFGALVAVKDGRPVGHACLLQVGPIAAIYGLYVVPSLRSQGIARYIMRDLINTCRRLELRTVVLEAEENNPAAMALYQRCGFERAGTSWWFFRRK